jgi:putative endopeptidase
MKYFIRTAVLSCFVIGIQPVFAQHDPAEPGKFIAIDRANMDFSYQPGDDFYMYASGTWVRNNPVPPKETRWGSFNKLRDFNITAVKNILDDAAKNPSAKPGSAERRVGDFYAAGMDSIAIEKLGYSPIKSDLQQAAALTDLQSVLNEAAYLRTIGAGAPLFGFSVEQDSKYVNNMVPEISQGGTSLPDRDYYLKSDIRSRQIQDAYKAYIARLFTLTGVSPGVATKNAETIFGIERKLAEAQMSRVELRDPYKTYNKFQVDELSKLTPGINWRDLMVKMNVSAQDTVLVNNPKFLTFMSELVKTIPVADWKPYMQWNILKSSAPYLSSSFVNAHFSFNQVMSGQRVQTPRWQRMSQLTDGKIGELLGQLYVDRYFKPVAKARMDTLIRNLIKAYEIRIRNLDWMSEATRQKALDKLHAFTPKIAYPDKWKNYDGMEISRRSFFQNLKNASSWLYNDMVGQLGKPVDRSRWEMTVPTVNAYYNPVNNEIVFPAGILQFPFFDPDADDAVNYGGIGAVIGHEISHGFDDQGSQYDKDGTLRNWWTDDDRTRFRARAEALEKQYNAYAVLDTLHVNGKLTLGENIGDLGGLNAAYEAFKMTRQGQSAEKIDGFTPDQRFFLAWAQVWRGNILDETAAQLIVTDPHSPGLYRTIGPLVNMDGWYKAFAITPGNKLYKKPENRIRLW